LARPDEAIRKRSALQVDQAVDVLRPARLEVRRHPAHPEERSWPEDLHVDASLVEQVHVRAHELDDAVLLPTERHRCARRTTLGIGVLAPSISVRWA
jgi:hypothetical protein